MVFLEMKHVTKRFGPVTANEDVSLSVQKGEIHALLGENGAGKTTLMNILYGLYTPTAGEIRMNGETLRIRSPKEAIEHGIGMVHQHFMLIPALTAIENVVLGLKEQPFVLNLKAAAKRFKEISRKYQMDLDPWVKVENLSVGQQQRLEIMKALFRKANLLILDEPTAVLTPQEVQGLFKMVSLLKKEGHAIIFISHKLAEILEICDRCTVLRRGKVVASMAVRDIQNKHQLAELMVGHEVDLETHKEKREPGDTVLEVRDLDFQKNGPGISLHDLSFQLHRGEILGICGVDGNGQSELVRCITGLDHPSSGKIFLSGRDCTRVSARQILQSGVSHIPEDRHRMGMIANMTLEENLMLIEYENMPYSRRGILNWPWIRKHTRQICQDYSIRAAGTKEKIGKLSGGNQQKLVVGRELDRRPKLLIAMHPSRGLDIGATKYIQSRILSERSRGAAVLLVSTELDELLALSDRILVMYSGKDMGLFSQKEATREILGKRMAGIA